MKACQPHESCRQHHDVDDKESAECHLSRGRTAFEEASHEITQDRRLVHDFDADGRRPIGALVPWQEIAGEAEAHHDAEERQTDQPDEFPWLLIGAPQKDLRHVGEHADHHRGRAPEMVAQEEPAIIHVVDDVLRTGIGVVGRRHVIEHQQDAGDSLHDENKEQDRAKDIGPTRPAGDGFVEHLGLQGLQPDTFVNEVEDLFNH